MKDFRTDMRKRAISVKWQLPVIQSNKTDHDWIHPKAKYHAFVDHKSICGSYAQNTNYFKTDIDEFELVKNQDMACKKCLKKLHLKTPRLKDGDQVIIHTHRYADHYKDQIFTVDGDEFEYDGERIVWLRELGEGGKTFWVRFCRKV